jgi:hypothetical protein
VLADLLDELASFFCTIGKHAKAEKLLGRSLQIKETALGPRHAKVRAVAPAHCLIQQSFAV